MEVTFLGSGNAFAAEGRYWSSFLVDGRYQFDAPPTLLPHLKRLGVDPAAIEVVFLTHQHGDHFMGLPFLLLEYIYMTERRQDLYIVGPPGVEAWMEDFASRCYPDIASADAGYRRVYVEAEPDWSERRAGPLAFRALQMNHVTKKMKALGYQVRIGDKTIAYTGDTMYCEEIYRLAEGADVLVVDCTYAEGSGPEHMGLDDVRLVRQRIAPETALVLTHLSKAPALNGMDNTFVAEDLRTFHF